MQSRGESHRSGKLDDEANAAELARKQTLAKGEGVGDEEEGKGFGLGIAPKESKPQSKIEQKEDGKDVDKDEEAERVKQAEDDLDFKEEQQSDSGPKQATKQLRPYKPRAEAFRDYRLEEGKTNEDFIKENRAELKQKKDELQDLKDQCNKAKAEIDRIKEKIEAKNDNQNKNLELEEEEDVIDEEEYNLIREVKEFKKAYKQAYDKLKNVKGDIYLINQNIDQLKQQLVTNFEVWYEENYDTSLEPKPEVSYPI